ncbi:MAG TPA: hypothetical protein VLH75_12940 [Longimicrobiales bacterium]|nr:hypothetical protein [Longimicrobiales bacterium]
MRHWVGLALAGCAAVALRLVPPSETPIPREAPPQDVVYERTLSADAALANARLRRIRLAARLIPATLADGEVLAFGVPEHADPVEFGRLHSDALRAARDARAGGADVALGVFFFLYGEGGYAGAPTGVVFDAEYYFGEQDGRTYCVSALPVFRPSVKTTVRLFSNVDPRNILGVCQAVARYGLPGEAARTWLERGGAALASAPTPSDPTHFTFITRLGSGFERRGFLGLPALRGASGPRTLVQERCFAGLEDACATLFLAPSDEGSVGPLYRRYAPVGFLASTPLSAALTSTPLEPADRHVLADLAAEFGEERVRRWWAADGDPGAAFRDAFGVEPGAWYAARVSRLVRIAEPGPGVTLNGIVGAFLILTLGTLVGSAWARRRSVA